MRTTIISQRLNNFDGLRLLAAALVVVGHLFVLTGHGPAPTFGGVPIHAIGVDIFFVVSGYLITTSWVSDPHLWRFLLKRVLRIGPALWVVVILTALVIGPLFSNYSVSEYYSNSKTYEYLLNGLLVGVYVLPGVFAGHWTSAVNGSLWTVGLEFCAYLLIGVGGLVLRHRLLLVTAALLIGSSALVLTFGPDKAWGATGRVWLYFALGASAKLVFRLKWFSPRIALVSIAVWFVVGTLDAHAGLLLSWVVIPYACLSIGLRNWPVIRSASRFGDLSYGIYLWSFLVEQCAISLFGAQNWLAVSAATISVSLLVSAASWHVIERRALSLKRRFATKAYSRALTT